MEISPVAGHRQAEPAGTARRVQMDKPLSSSSQPEREIQALRERIAALSTAILRVNASLDVDTVLHEIAESARALTGARYAVIVTIDQARALEDPVISGFASDERRQVEGWTDNLGRRGWWWP